VENRFNYICHIRDDSSPNDIHRSFLLKMEAAGSSKRLSLFTNLQGTSYQKALIFTVEIS
jgi:hypothetical protein